jgi:hypothetical protein
MSSNSSAALEKFIKEGIITHATPVSDVEYHRNQLAVNITAAVFLALSFVNAGLGSYHYVINSQWYTERKLKHQAISSPEEWSSSKNGLANKVRTMNAWKYFHVTALMCSLLAIGVAIIGNSMNRTVNNDVAEARKY